MKLKIHIDGDLGFVTTKEEFCITFGEMIHGAFPVIEKMLRFIRQILVGDYDEEVLKAVSNELLEWKNYKT